MSEGPLSILTRPLEPIGAQAWAVGGGVRDLLIGREVGEIDVAVAGDAARAAARLADAHGRAVRFPLSTRYGSWRVQGGSLSHPIDLTPLQGETIEEDLARRDLTVNAIAVPAAGGAPLDPHGGRADIEARRLRLVGPDALRDDPVRLLRLPRLALQLGFGVEDATVARARADSGLVWTVAGERLRDELGRMLRLPGASRAIRQMDELGVLGALVPQLEQARGMEQSPFHDRDVLGHTLEVVRVADELDSDPSPVFRSQAEQVRAELSEDLADDLTRGQALLLAALLHDMAKPATRDVTSEGRVTFMAHDRVGADMADDLCRRLKVSTRLREFVVHLVRYHLPLGFAVHQAPLSLRAIHRYLRATGPYAGEVIVLSAADRIATAGPRTRRSQIDRHLALAREVMEVHLRERAEGPARPPLAGNELADALGRTPGPWLGELMVALEEEVAVGAVRDRGAAIRFGRRWCAGEVPPRAVPGMRGVTWPR